MSVRTCTKNSNMVPPLHPTLRHRESTGTWRSQRDATQLLNDFERQAWTVSKRLCYVPFVRFITLGDDLMGTRSADNQVKMLSEEIPIGKHTARTLSLMHYFDSPWTAASGEAGILRHRLVTSLDLSGRFTY